MFVRRILFSLALGGFLIPVAGFAATPSPHKSSKMHSAMVKNPKNCGKPHHPPCKVGGSAPSHP